MLEKGTPSHTAPDNGVVHKEQVTYLLLILLQIAHDDAKGSENYEEAYRKRLKFQKQTDWKRYRASVDLLNDTEYAIMSAFEYQLGDLSIDNGDTGEVYLRLYGVLNAVYLQMSAFKEIANLLNYPERSQVAYNFEKLSIYRLRNIAASHTVDYRYDKELQIQHGVKTSTSFRIIQFKLDKTGSKISALDENDISFEFNLLDTLGEYEMYATDLLIKLINHFINTLVYRKEDKNEIKKRLDELLPNLVDYTKMNRNHEYKINRMNKIRKIITN